MEKFEMVTKNGTVIMTREYLVKKIVIWAISGEELSPEDSICINNAKQNFDHAYTLRELVFEAMSMVPLGSSAWKRLFDIA